FRPERFINADGTFRKDERMIPFGKGRRLCLGEPLARMTSFLLFAALVQHLDFELDPAVPVTNTEGVAGFTLGPPEFRVFAKRRC
ncbi:cytochrome P450 18a1, partial [Penaeus vannamei]